MSEYNQVDFQIGTEEQLETKKADLAEGVIVGLTDLIHESELDEGLQTKINSGGNNYYKHDLTIPCRMNDAYEIDLYLKITAINSTKTPYTFNTFCEEVINETRKFLVPCYALISESAGFTTGAVMVYDVIADVTDEEYYFLTVKALLFEDFDGAMQPERELEGVAEIGDIAFGDTVTEL